MTQELSDLGEHIATSIENDVHNWKVVSGELNVEVRPDRIAHVMLFMRDDPLTRFSVLIDLAGVDYPERTKRFDVVYHLLSMQNNMRVRVRASIGSRERIPTVSGIYPCADWYEREAFDMYGIVFTGHTDLRRILTDYNFSGYPLRKDFPLTGHVEVRYDDRQKRVVYEPVRLVQEYRNFDRLSPWEGIRQPSSGDDPQARRD